MSAEGLLAKYIDSAEQVFRDISVSEVSLTVDVKSVKEILSFAKCYLDDARFYMEKEKHEVGLTSIAYCEGLLDALRMLGAVKFKWPEKREKKRSQD
jgi:hypothetical protein